MGEKQKGTEKMGKLTNDVGNSYLQEENVGGGKNE